MTVLNVREVTRGGRILGDFSPPPIVLPFSWGGGRGRGHSSQALAFLLSLTDKNDKNKAPLSLSGKIRVYSRSKSSFFKNLQAVNH